jgi:tripartite-type tricarboxylate transporter receptor subunit TctC
MAPRPAAMSIRASRRAALGGLAALLARPALAQGAWPNRPIRLIVPFAAGTTTDILGRILAEAIGRQVGQTIVVDNRAGAGGNVGALAVARAPADGYTLLLGTNGTHGINASLFTDQGFDPVKDFTPIAPFVTTAAVLGITPSLGVSSVAELVALAKRRPLTFASAGNGTTTDLVAGRVDGMFYHPLGLKPQLDVGALKALAVTSEKRVSILPDLPTMAEAGLQDFVVEGRWHLFGPAGLPPEIVVRLNKATNDLLADPAALANLRAQGVEPLGGTPEALGEMTRAEIAKWRPVVAAANIRPD